LSDSPFFPLPTSHSLSSPPALDSSFKLRSYPRDLPSFPTRRSSDLALGAREVGRERPDAGRMILGVLGVGVDLRLLDQLEADGLDRKSTRLNSSHVKISYAVFCLKKKKSLCRYSTTIRR